MARAGASRCVAPREIASAPSQHHTFHGLLAADAAPSTEAAVNWIILIRITQCQHEARYALHKTKLNLETSENMLQSGVIPFSVSARAAEQGVCCLLV